jgi:hypothetical protein
VAMAVFNLDKDIWNLNLSGDEIESSLNRVNGSSKFIGSDKLIIDS